MYSFIYYNCVILYWACVIYPQGEAGTGKNCGKIICAKIMSRKLNPFGTLRIKTKINNHCSYWRRYSTHLSVTLEFIIPITCGQIVTQGPKS